MKQEEFIDKFDLHDSSIQKCDYYIDTKKIILEVSLCQWRQSFYKGSDPDVVVGVFEFDEVTKYENAYPFIFGNMEILEAKIISDQQYGEAIKIVGLINEDGVQDVPVIIIKANRIKWHPYEC